MECTSNTQPKSIALNENSKSGSNQLNGLKNDLIENKYLKLFVEEHITSEKIKTTPTQLQLTKLRDDIKKITEILINLAKGDHEWWKLNILQLTSQPFHSILRHLSTLEDASFTNWNTYFPKLNDMEYFEPLEAVVWLASLCQLDQLLIGALPRHFIDEFNLQWQVLALHWL